MIADFHVLRLGSEMKINLRRASELDQRLSRRISELRSKLAPAVSVPIFRTTAAFHKHLRKSMHTIVQQIDTLEEIRYEVRDMIAEANVSAGLSSPLTKSALDASGLV
jgi:hypothetical protein